MYLCLDSYKIRRGATIRCSRTRHGTIRYDDVVSITYHDYCRESKEREKRKILSHGFITNESNELYARLGFRGSTMNIPRYIFVFPRATPRPRPRSRTGSVTLKMLVVGILRGTAVVLHSTVALRNSWQVVHT